MTTCSKTFIFLLARLWPVQAALQETCMQQSFLQVATQLDPVRTPVISQREHTSEFATFSKLFTPKSVRSPMHIQLDLINTTLGHLGNFNVFAYNGSIPGPTLLARAGESIEIFLKNNLRFGVPCDDDPDLSWCDMQVTNLHTHGLHVSASTETETKYPDIADDATSRIKPGREGKFHIKLPDDHFPGTFLYHAHPEHSAGLQAGTGASGLLVVEDPPGFLPEVYANMEERHLLMHSIGPMTVIAKMAISAKARAWEQITQRMMDNGLSDEAYIILTNGQMGPTTDIDAGKWYRFRMGMVSPDSKWLKAYIEEAEHQSCEMKLLAKDGIYLNTFPRNVSTVYLASGNRADVAVRCECQAYPCGVKWVAHNWRPPDAPGEPEFTETMLIMNISDSGAGTKVDLPSVSLPRPCYLGDLRKAEVSDVNTLSFIDVKIQEVPEGETTPSPYMLWNNMSSTMNSTEYMRTNTTMLTWAAASTWPVGSVHEVRMDHIDRHALHFHINPMQILELPEEARFGGWFEDGDYADTFANPALGQFGVAKVRLMTDMFTGRMMFHCHALAHEDRGLMGIIDIVGDEGYRNCSFAW